MSSRTGCQWQGLDQTEWCAHSTAHGRFQAWVEAGVFFTLWQAVAGEGFDVTHLQITWAEQRATCPQGKSSIRWGSTHPARRKTLISMGFALSDCLLCPMRSRCMRAKGQACSLLVQGHAEHVALHQRRAKQQTEALLALYHQRAGIEGTLSEARTGLWLTVCQISRAGKNPFAGRGDRHRDHYLPLL